MAEALRLEMHGNHDAAIALYDDVAKSNSEHASYARSCATRLREQELLRVDSGPTRSSLIQGGAMLITTPVIILLLVTVMRFARVSGVQEARQAGERFEQAKARLLEDPEFRAKWEGLNGQNDKQLRLVLERVYGLPSEGRPFEDGDFPASPAAREATSVGERRQLPTEQESERQSVDGTTQADVP